MSKRNMYLNYGQSKAVREELYSELTDEGKFFVDYIALTMLEKFKQRSTAPLGEQGMRELALAVLQHCWDGIYPAGYPVLVEVG